jgi:hypothetical protein
VFVCFPTGLMPEKWQPLPRSWDGAWRLTRIYWDFFRVDNFRALLHQIMIKNAINMNKDQLLNFLFVYFKCSVHVTVIWLLNACLLLMSLFLLLIQTNNYC